MNLDGVEAPATIIRSPRRRRTIAITVDSPEVTVRVPMRTTRRQIEEAVQKHRAWILLRLASPSGRPPAPRFESGESIPFQGGHLTLAVEACAARRVSIRALAESLVACIPDSLIGDERSRAVQSALTRWYREQAESLFHMLVRQWSAAAGLMPTKVKVRDQRRRWGSCGPDGTLRFNWRLVLVERELAEYVVVHELAHLRHRNHQAEFWAVVAALLPDHLARRKRLTAIGRTLLQ